MASSLNIDTSDTFAPINRVVIEGTTYVINFYWNYRSGWFCGLYDTQLVPVGRGSTGIKLMRGTNILQYLNGFTGQLLIVDTEPVEGEDYLTETNFGEGKRFQVWYFSQSDISSLAEYI